MKYTNRDSYLSNTTPDSGSFAFSERIDEHLFQALMDTIVEKIDNIRV